MLKIEIKIKEKEFDKVVRDMAAGMCPKEIGLRDAEGSYCGFGLCRQCWKDALIGGAKSGKSFLSEKSRENRAE